MLSFAPRSLEAWIAAIHDADIPVLAQTAIAIEAMHENEDDIAARDIAEVVLDDPLMSLKVLAHVARHRPARVVTDTETVTGAILMMGITAFFKNFGQQETVETRLGAFPGALEGLDRVMRRSHRAARFAVGFAICRQDTDAEVIQEAALLHDFAEALLWCHAPGLALEIERRQAADPTLRSAKVQREVLNIELADLEQALMKDWRLPELLQQLTDDHNTAVPRVRNVMLATALARHSQNGWRNAALPDDFIALGELLNLSPEAARGLVRELDSTAMAELD
jgi:HD-like signal output (HDOD) protein